MKIVHVVIGGELAGGQLIARKLIEGARRHGHDGSIVSPTRGAFTDAAEAAGIPVRYADVSRSFKLGGLLELRRILRDEGADIVHTHAELASNILSRIAARTSGRAVVSHVHAPTTFRQLPLVAAAYKKADNLTARLCARIVAVSDATREGLVAQGIPARLVETIHNGFDPPDPVPEPADPGLDGRRIVVCIGRVEPAKGQAELIAALAELPDDTTAVIVGGDVDGHRARPERLASDHGVRERVFFTGQRPDALAIVAASDVVVLPSWTEGLPIVPLEAMALRKPVVATAVGGTPEVVDGETGLLVPPRDPPALTAALREELADPDRARSPGEAGYGRLREHFSEARMVDRVLAVYEQAHRPRRAR